MARQLQDITAISNEVMRPIMSPTLEDSTVRPAVPLTMSVAVALYREPHSDLCSVQALSLQYPGTHSHSLCTAGTVTMS